MDERDYKRRIEAKRRIISQSELEKRENMSSRNSSNNEKPQRKGQSKQKKSQYGLFAGMVCLLAMVILIFAFYLLFYVQQIEVTGNEYSASEDVVEWLASDPMCKNSIAMYVKYNFTDTQLSPQIDEISVKIVNPWTLRVESIDKTPVGGIIVGDKYVYCDIEGIVILEADNAIDELPVIQGVSVEEYTLYEVLPIEDIEIFKNALEVTSILNLEEIEFDEISCSSGAGVNVEIDGIDVKLGEDNYQEKILQLEPILEELEGANGILDLENYNTSNSTINFTQENTEN